MDQRSTAIVMLLVVVLGLGGIVLWDMKTNNRLETAREKTNWLWGDNWNSEIPQVDPKQEEQEEPKQEEEQKPDHQLVATSHDQAIQEAGKYGMPILMFFEADWCSWCKKMKSETLTDSKVKEVMKNYVLLYVNTDQNRELAKKFGVRVLPSYVISNCNEDKLKSDEGFKDANEFAKWLDNPSLYKQPKKGDQVRPNNPKPEEPQSPEEEPQRRFPRRPQRG